MGERLLKVLPQTIEDAMLPSNRLSVGEATELAGQCAERLLALVAHLLNVGSTQLKQGGSGRSVFGQHDALIA